MILFLSHDDGMWFAQWLDIDIGGVLKLEFMLVLSLNLVIIEFQMGVCLNQL